MSVLKQRGLKLTAILLHVSLLQESSPLQIGARRASARLPGLQHVAVLLWGPSFHEGYQGCSLDATIYGNQLAATESLVENIIEPLEQAENDVEVIFTDRVCNQTGRLLEILTPWVTAVKQHPFGDQLADLTFACNVLKERYGGMAGVEGVYDYLIVTRHDVIWKTSIGDWDDLDFSRFSFPSRCGEARHEFHCRNDAFIMPSSLFAAFDQEAGEGRCFTSAAEGADDFGCYDRMVSATAELNGTVGYATPWEPRTPGSRGDNPFFPETNPFFSIY